MLSALLIILDNSGAKQSACAAREEALVKIIGFKPSNLKRGQRRERERGEEGKGRVEDQQIRGSRGAKRPRGEKEGNLLKGFPGAAQLKRAFGVGTWEV